MRDALAVSRVPEAVGRPIPCGPVAQQRRYETIPASMAPSQGLMTAFVFPRTDTAVMNCFLEHVSHALADFFIVMQVDQVGWHRCKDLVLPENARLIYQPT